MSNFHSVPNTPPPFHYFDHSPREQSPHHILFEDTYQYRSPPSTVNIKQSMIGQSSSGFSSLERSPSSSNVGSNSYCFSPLPQQSPSQYYYNSSNGQSIKTTHPIPLKISPSINVHNSQTIVGSYHKHISPSTSSSLSTSLPNPIIHSTPFVRISSPATNNNNNNISPSMSPNHNNNNLPPNNNNNTTPMSPVFERALIPLLNLKQCKPDFDLNSSFTISPKYSSSVPTTPGELTPTSAGRNPLKEPSPTTILSPTSSTCSSLPESPRAVCSSYPSSPSSTPSSTPRGVNNNGEKSDLPYPKQAEQQWKKLEYYANEFNHFIFETLKTKEFNQIEALNAKLSEITNTVKEIEITNSIYKSLPPQTRARKKRATKAEKLQKDLLGIKRTYVTTPKSKGNYCFFCGTMETPEWRKGPGGHKTLCNACGLHYAKNIKKESIRNNQQPTEATTSCSSMNVSALVEN